MKFIIEPLAAYHDREAFDCEEPSLNDFLKLYARQNDKKGLGKTFVAVTPDKNTKIGGYYTISSGALDAENLPENLPRYSIPIMHIGRLAVDKTVKGQGLGNLLLLDALRRSMNAGAQIGVYAVEVRALTEQAKSFYLKFGFVEMTDDPLRLYLTIKKIRKLDLV